MTNLSGQVGAIDAALYAVLNPLTASGAWNGQAYDGTATPYVVYQFVTDTNRPGMRGGSDVTTYLYLVKAQSEQVSPLEALELEALINAALHRQTLTVEGYGFARCMRRNGFRAPNENTGWQVGAYYEITLYE